MHWKFLAPTVAALGLLTLPAAAPAQELAGTLKKIKDSGGTAEQKAPIPGQGWFAACTDPDGNSFSLFQSDPTVTMEQMTEYQEAHT